jgi:sulfate adenylyltransferase subunit 1
MAAFSSNSHPASDSWAGRQIRFMTAGSVDDGKSTLIGRFLLDSQGLMRDQASALARGADDALDLAALTDGLEAEQAQGITIDVAYRYFATPSTSFIIADAPGHEQFTRNMVTAASTSDIAVIVIDAARFEGALRDQTRRHAAIAAMMGLGVIVAVNKMDLTDWSQARFEAICAAFGAVAAVVGLDAPVMVPVSAKAGDNVVRRGGASWYAGPTLAEALEQAGDYSGARGGALRLPVQLVLREGARRLYAGRIEAGSVRPGDAVRVGPGLLPATVTQVLVRGAGVPVALAGTSVAVELSDERDLGPGGVIAAPGAAYARRVVADLCWLDEAPFVPARRYRLRQGTLETQALIETVRSVRDVATLAQHPASALALNDIASVQVAVRDPLLADLYTDYPATGGFVLIDPVTNQTAAAGLIREILP